MTDRYVAFEGIDGAGKTTVAQQVRRRLEDAGFQTVFVREPGGTAVGEAIRTVLLDPSGTMEAWPEAMLFAAQRAQLVREVVGPALDDGIGVVSDRSVYSSLAYQGGARGLGIDEVRAVNAAGLAGIWPAQVVLLRLDPETGLAREDESDRISVAGVELQQRVAEAYDLLAEAEPDTFIVVDAARPLAEVVAESAQIVADRW